MSITDWIIIGTMVIGLISGLVRGFLRQLFSLGGLLLGVVLGSMLFKPFAEFLSGVVTMQPHVAQVVAFAIILIIVPIVCGILGRLLSKVVKDSGLGILNRLLGAVSGLLIWLLLAGMTIKFLDMTGISAAIPIKEESDKDKQGSVLYAPLRDVSATCLQWTWKKVLDMDLPKFDRNEGQD